MLGAIIGDIAGSRFEFNNHKSKAFELLAPDCRVTDDSLMTLAVAKGIMETEKVKGYLAGGDKELDADYCSLLAQMTVKNMQELGRKYPDCGFGGMFSKWIISPDPQPYNSFGNGAAMRISPVGFVARDDEEVFRFSEAVTGVTHNHPEGLKGAEATALAIFMARSGCSKEKIKEKIAGSYYSLNFTLEEIRDTYHFDETCQGSVPQAIVAFLEADSFEDTIRNAISIGGDSDTIAAIAGAIAEAYYGVPQELKEKALKFLDKELYSIYQDWIEFMGQIKVKSK